MQKNGTIHFAGVYSILRLNLISSSVGGGGRDRMEGVVDTVGFVVEATRMETTTCAVHDSNGLHLKTQFETPAHSTHCSEHFFVR
mmetsp:Transcript_9609/g.17326  ORF Transcript_9609/g.17326 Transcript_9609/m.17326 type:complete len:85 (+) Transcript_9609:1209-1463(+)